MKSLVAYKIFRVSFDMDFPEVETLHSLLETPYQVIYKTGGVVNKPLIGRLFIYNHLYTALCSLPLGVPYDCAVHKVYVPEITRIEEIAVPMYWDYFERFWKYYQDSVSMPYTVTTMVPVYTTPSVIVGDRVYFLHNGSDPHYDPRYHRLLTKALKQKASPPSGDEKGENVQSQ